MARPTLFEPTSCHVRAVCRCTVFLTNVRYSIIEYLNAFLNLYESKQGVRETSSKMWKLAGDRSSRVVAGRR